MADYYPATISIPKKFAEREDIQELLNGEFPPAEHELYWEKYEHEGVVYFTKYQARYGYFEYLEEKFQAMGIPYDRHTEGHTEAYDNYPEHVVFFRPDNPDPHRRLITIRTIDGDPFVKVDQLLPLLDASSKEIKRKLKEIVDTAAPLIVSLKAYNV